MGRTQTKTSCRRQRHRRRRGAIQVELKLRPETLQKVREDARSRNETVAQWINAEIEHIFEEDPEPCTPA